MSTAAFCEHCFNPFVVQDRQAGTITSCPECHGAVLVQRSRQASSRSGTRRRRTRRGEPGDMILRWTFGLTTSVVLLLVTGMVVSKWLPDTPQPSVEMTSIAAQSAKSVDTSMKVLEDKPVTPQKDRPQVKNASTEFFDTIDTSTDAQDTEVTRGIEAQPSTDDDKRQFADRVERSVVLIVVTRKKGRSLGSGFVLDKDGTIVTNYHVVTGAIEAEVQFKDGTKSKVTGFLKLDPSKDIAILDCDADPDRLFPIPLAATLPHKLQPVVAAGAPERLGWSLTEGTVSGIRSRKDLAEIRIYNRNGTWIQSTAAISKGNSGGPLVNMQGEVVGANTMSIEGEGTQSLNFAISSIDIQKAYDLRNKKPTPLTTGAIPELDPTQLPLIDESGTSRGQQLLAETVELTFLWRYADGKPTPQLHLFMKTKAQDAVNHATVTVRKACRNILLITIECDETLIGKGRLGVSLTMSMELLCIDHEANDQSQIVRVWKDQATIGKIPLNVGRLPTRIQANIQKFFRKFGVAKRRAVRLAKAAADSTPM